MVSDALHGRRRTALVLLAMCAGPVLFWSPAAMGLALIVNSFTWLIILTELTSEIRREHLQKHDEGGTHEEVDTDPNRVNLVIRAARRR